MRNSAPTMIDAHHFYFVASVLTIVAVQTNLPTATAAAE
jgi:hypothetical protein